MRGRLRINSIRTIRKIRRQGKAASAIEEEARPRAWCLASAEAGDKRLEGLPAQHRQTALCGLAAPESGQVLFDKQKAGRHRVRRQARGEGLRPGLMH